MLILPLRAVPWCDQPSTCRFAALRKLAARGGAYVQLPMNSFDRLNAWAEEPLLHGWRISSWVDTWYFVGT